MFQTGRKLNSSHDEATSSGMFELDQSDSFSNVTYVIFWEQNYMGTARRLRSTHVFGDGVMTSYSSLSILPTSAQMGDTTGTINYDQTDSGGEFSTPAAAPASSNSESSVNWGLIVGVASGVVVLFGAGYYLYSMKKPSATGTANATGTAKSLGSFFSYSNKMGSFFSYSNKMGSFFSYSDTKPLRKPTPAQVRKNYKKGYKEVRIYEQFTTDF